MGSFLNAAVGLGFLALLLASVAPPPAVTRLGPSAVLLDQAETAGGLTLEPALALDQSSAWGRGALLTAAKAGNGPCLPDVAVGDRITLSAESGKRQELLVTRRDDAQAGSQTRSRRSPAVIECWLTDAASGALIRVLIEAKPAAPVRPRMPLQKL